MTNHPPLWHKFKKTKTLELQLTLTIVPRPLKGPASHFEPKPLLQLISELHFAFFSRQSHVFTWKYFLILI